MPAPPSAASSRKRSGQRRRPLAAVPALCLAFGVALGPGDRSAVAAAPPSPPLARHLSGFTRDSEFVLAVDGVPVPVELYKAESAGAIVLISPSLHSPLVLRAGTLATVDAGKLLKHPDATLDVATDAVLTPRGTFEITQDGVAFTIDGHRASVRHVDPPPLLGLRRLDEVTAHNPEYLAGASRYAVNSQAVAALRQERRLITVRVYYGSWCPHCRMLVPHAIRLEHELRGSRIRFEYFGLRNPLKDPAAIKAGVSEIPTGVVFAHSRELGRILSDSDWQALELTLRRVLAGPP
ncbi:MAG TPA: thioredoxin family protein [Thermoanaerobaculia bacterium]